MRINKMITKEKMPRSFIKVSQLILKGNVWRSVWRICMRLLGLKGLIEDFVYTLCHIPVVRVQKGTCNFIITNLICTST